MYVYMYNYLYLFCCYYEYLACSNFANKAVAENLTIVDMMVQLIM